MHGFISSNRINDLVSQFKLQILQKLVPGLQKDGYLEEDIRDATASSSNDRPPTTGGAARPRGSIPDNAPPHERLYQPPPTFPRDNPLQIGRRDLDPIPMHPFSPPSLFGQPSSGDGMFVGPDHPIWAGRNPGGPGHFPDERGPWGGDGYLPQMGAPPGARFDPIGPDTGLGPGLGPFPPGRGGQGNRPGGLRGPHAGPDNDEFMPPGMVHLLFILKI